MLTVFLSSTSKDLEKCRDAAYHAIEGLHGYHCVRMEDFGSWDEAPDDFCRAKVAECDLFICLAGPLYGSVAPAGSSYTDREFQAAVDHGKPCLVFMTAEDFPLPPSVPISLSAVSEAPTSERRPLRSTVDGRFR
jgi:hypothetical protein